MPNQHPTLSCSIDVKNGQYDRNNAAIHLHNIEITLLNYADYTSHSTLRRSGLITDNIDRLITEYCSKYNCDKSTITGGIRIYER